MRARFATCWLAALTMAGVAVACGDDDHTPGGSSAGGDEQAGAAHAGMPAAGAPDRGGSESNGGDAGSGSDLAGTGGALGGAGAGDGGDGGAAPFKDDLHRPGYPPSPYPAENPDSLEKGLLGKILFWDEQMGGDGTMACGTCHRPNAGGSDPRSATVAAAQAGPDQVFDTADDIHGSLGVVRCNAQGQHTGVSVQVTGRKAPTYLDAMFNVRLFWDGRAQCTKDTCPSFNAFEDPDNLGTFPITSGAALENQAVGPPLSPVEMACEDPTWAGIHARLAGATPLAKAKQIPTAMADFITAHDSSYPELFKAAFGTAHTSGPETEINTRRIAMAIATHERHLRSDQTPWDRWNAGEEDALTPGQRRGLELFMKKAACEGCHRVPMFADGDFHFIGFHEPAWDLGRKAIDTAFGRPGAMRTPTLRNVGLREATGLLHNGAGAGASLEAIVTLYNLGGLVDNEAVTSVPIDTQVTPLFLSDAEQVDLLDFLRHGLEDPRVGAQTAPFDRPLLSTE